MSLALHYKSLCISIIAYHLKRCDIFDIEYYWTELFKVFFSVNLDKYFDAVTKISTDMDIIKNLTDNDFQKVGMKPDEIKVLRSRLAMCNDTKGSVS